MVFSASNVASFIKFKKTAYYFFNRQLLFLVASLIISFIIIRVNSNTYGPISWLVILGVIGILIWVLISGKMVNQARSWINIFGIQFQPSEVAKIACIVWVSSVYTNKTKLDLKSYFMLLAVVFGIAILIILQPDMGTAVIFLTIVFIVAAACCCNGLFYFKHQISGICDVIVVAESTLGNNMTSKMVFTAHGLFIKSEEYVCSPNCILADCTLDRPDYAIGAFKTKQFSWRADSGSCTAFEEKTPTVNPYSLYEGVFETKSPAVFNNHNCFAFINMTEPNLILYGNDKTGEMFGFKSGDYTVTVEYSSAQHSPETFVMDPNYENCAEDSFIPPDQQVYDEACNAIPTDASF